MIYVLYPPEQSLIDYVHGVAFDTEDECADVLETIWNKMPSHGGPAVAPASLLMPAISAWAGLMSYAVMRTYGPRSPMRYATWSQNVASMLWKACEFLRFPLEYATAKIGASGYSISVQFPLGVSVGVTWPPSAEPHDRPDGFGE